uniref:Ig-like domain-containing protein n=1 Tax=Chelonoidis abingdonii TaxID=106734 RepID=A0A8C0GQ30_CHEAB
LEKEVDSGWSPWGGAVTIWCHGQHQNMRFLLYKEGNPTALQDAEPAGKVAEFPIRNMNRRDAGSYSCYYHDKMYQFLWSHPSDPVELVVAGEGPGSVFPLPAPQPARPSGCRAHPPQSVGLEHRTLTNSTEVGLLASLFCLRQAHRTDRQRTDKTKPPPDLKVSCLLIGPLGQVSARLPELLNPLQVKGFCSSDQEGFYSTVYRKVVTLLFIFMTSKHPCLKNSTPKTAPDPTAAPQTSGPAGTSHCGIS